jgi:hypothetical protein
VSWTRVGVAEGGGASRDVAHPLGALGRRGRPTVAHLSPCTALLPTCLHRLGDYKTLSRSAQRYVMGKAGFPDLHGRALESSHSRGCEHTAAAAMGIALPTAYCPTSRRPQIRVVAKAADGARLPLGPGCPPRHFVEQVIEAIRNAPRPG